MRTTNTRAVTLRGMVIAVTLLILISAAALPSAAIMIDTVDDGVDELPGNNILLYSCDFAPANTIGWKTDFDEFVGGDASISYHFGIDQDEQGSHRNDGFLLQFTTEDSCGEKTLDISNMKTLVFSLYLSCPPEQLKKLNFWTTGLQLSSANAPEKEMRMWTLEQILDFYIVGEPVIGWNTVMIPLTSSDDYMGRFDLKEFNYWRFHAIGGRVDEQTDITIKLDRMYFTDESAPCMTQVTVMEARILKDLADVPEFHWNWDDYAQQDLFARNYPDWRARVDAVWYEIEQMPEHLQYQISAEALNRLNRVTISLAQYEKFLKAQEEALQNPPVDKNDPTTGGGTGEDTVAPLPFPPSIGGGQGSGQNSPIGSATLDFLKNKMVLLLCLEIGAAALCVVIISVVVHNKRKKQKAAQKPSGKLNISELANRIDISNIGR